MDIEGERKSRRRRKRDGGRDRATGRGDIGKNEGKGEVVCLSPSLVGVRRKKSGREKEKEGWRITVEAKGPRENSVLGVGGRGNE